MSKIFDVPAMDLIEEMAQALKQEPELKAPVFAPFVKTGSHKERAPQNQDWWFVRMASILYQAYKTGNVGTGRLRSYYGGRKANGVKPHHFRKSGGKVIRLCLQQLEKQGYLAKAKKGRTVTGKGEKFLNDKAKQALQTMAEKKEKAKAMAIEKEKQRLEREQKEKASQGSQSMKKDDYKKGKEKEKDKKAKKDQKE